MKNIYQGLSNSEIDTLLEIRLRYINSVRIIFITELFSAGLIVIFLTFIK